ncbi:CRISPR-associated protein Cas5, subtype I-A/APERN [Archaeoglobus sulfaticallidus PM70-1]|uniref:CRISPR-associated protein Cas5, subtype I-A/APERN n=1 Tax=Archaeoglobus sulfaticallidus PM70-1 TaxID=387631 RepID=N0BCA3_9EURY|nr:type I-A CRISPR-associated protein Cas5a [Archaeoglobus sulfaticallidus]AGK61249.1 CRISPR-associated protein Cas5, subtype I-A/APERN [Archaeoglobus sulfaticallidus PM70-1]
MQWVKLSLHFPSFFSYRIPDYSSQYALSVPLPSPSAIKLAVVATAIRATGNVAEGECVFYAVRDADIRIVPPEQIAINSVLIRRLKKKKNPTELETFERTFGVREYVFFPDDINLLVGCDDIDTAIKYFGILRYLGSSDSMLYVKRVEQIEEPPESAIKAITDKEFVEAISKESYVIYPVNDISKKAKFEQINPYSEKSGRNVFERKYYLIKAKIKKGKNWKVLEIWC